MGTRRWFSLAGIFMLSLSVTARTQELQRSSTSSSNSEPLPATPAPVMVPALLPLRNPRKLTLTEEAYLDAYGLLKEDSRCSRFFGGPASIEALNRLAQELKVSHLDRSVAIRMTGHTINVLNALTGFTYRTFDREEVNVNGPFFSGNSSPTEPHIHPVGIFRPNTREARVTLLLHELGHMLPNHRGGWVLPDDGDDFGQSERNTRQVIQVCGAQLNTLHRISFADEFLKAQPQIAGRSGSEAGH